MGNSNSQLFKVCRTPKKTKNPQDKEDDDQDFTDSAIVQRNKDNYFSKEDYDKIMEKYPLFKEWIDESANAQTKEKPKHKKIRWKEAEVIGLGSYGRVIMGLDLDTGTIMATKQVQLGNINNPAQQERIKALKIEIDLLSRFSHKNIVRYYGSQKSKNTFNIFLEYVSGGSIASLLDKYGPFNENLIRVYTRQILEGLEYLHVRNTIHRDIKGANILVDNSGICKLADFGTATKISGLIESDMKDIPSIKGTVRWMAPEIIKQTSLGRFCDIWSVGCTLIEMATAKPPWSDCIKSNSNSVGIGKISTLYQIAQFKTHPPLPKKLSPEAIDFLKQCFKINPQERPNVIKLLQHKFISGVENLYQSFESFSSKDSQQQNTSKFNSKTTQTKSNAQADVESKHKTACTEVVPKILNKQYSAPPKGSTLDKEKEIELEKDTKSPSRYPWRIKDQSKPVVEYESSAENFRFENANLAIESENNIEQQQPSNPKFQGVKGGYKSKGKYLVQANLDKESSADIEPPGASKNSKSFSKTKTSLGSPTNTIPRGDLKKNITTKINVAPRPLRHHSSAARPEEMKYSESIEKYSTPKNGRREESPSMQKGIGESKYEPSEIKIQIKENLPKSYLSQDFKISFKRSGSKEITHKIQEENEEQRQQYNDRSPGGRKTSQNNTDKKDSKEEDSNSRDSDRDPSLNGSEMKRSGNLGGVDNASFSTQGRNMRINVHDQSSQLSIKKEASFEAKGEQGHGEGSLQIQEKKYRKVRRKSETAKVELSILPRKNVEGNMTPSKNDERMNKILDNWNQMVPENEAVFDMKKSSKKKQEYEKNSKKEMGDGEYLQNFNLLEDLNKIYGQLEASNPPLNS